ncbi:MAG TPA: glycosyltransferase family 2 protein [Candidatus Saccharimonadales bacterium]|jgi:cellulose synthase/poly-beta-1,6-N-acetylglucosamine synthase-like glycosyltransferase|nr:glycosyltransferase family 2 protein [Candidatus Saccharimonadales bacterium]
MTSTPRKNPLRRETSVNLLSRGQQVTLIVLAVVTIVCLILWIIPTLTTIVAICLAFYTLSQLQKFCLHIAAIRHPLPHIPPLSMDDPNLPTYTILAPMYHEPNMVKDLVESLDEMHYPDDKRQGLLLLEKDDIDTQAAAMDIDLPGWIDVVVVEHAKPKGKPKALNIGLAQATGDHCVIYDAEDRPDPDQLLKAAAAFREYPPEVACVQARLFFWNESSSWITRFYWAEYVVHFEWVLRGLAKLGLIPPLGGTSNHFRTDVLRKIAYAKEQLPKGVEGIGGWDPWNVTEDGELAGALGLNGYSIEMIDSVTYEEAPKQLSVANKQRQRWLKGYLQTGLVYTRHPMRTARQMGFRRWFSYILMMLGTPIGLWLNPIMWGLTITYFITRSSFVESLFPPVLFYLGIMLMVAGNLLLFYQLVGACLHRGGYGTVKYLFLMPFWWAVTSWSAYVVLWQLPRESVWNKTPHGHDVFKRHSKEKVAALALQEKAVPAYGGAMTNNQKQTDLDAI